MPVYFGVSMISSCHTPGTPEWHSIATHVFKAALSAEALRKQAAQAFRCCTNRAHKSAMCFLNLKTSAAAQSGPYEAVFVHTSAWSVHVPQHNVNLADVTMKAIRGEVQAPLALALQ